MTTFTDAFGGFGGFPVTSVGENQVLFSALISDELFITGNATYTDWDSRDPLEPAKSSAEVFNPLHRARINLLSAIASMQRTTPDSTARIGNLFALVAYSEVFFGENFCAGVTLGGLDPAFRPLYGQPLTTAQLFEQALADFDSALVYGVDSARIANLARVGKGRALLNLGRFSEAAQTVANVPTSYVYNATFVAGILQNGIYGSVTRGRNFWTVPEREGTNGINWRTANDPRVSLINRSPAVKGLDGLTDVWAFVPYETNIAPIRLAGGIEARLIEAEAALQVGDAPTWLSVHNTLRATVGLAALADPGTSAGRVDLHFRERAFWLFLTGHRHGDLRRLVRQYGRSSEAVFPTGAWRDGLTYGTATNMAPGNEARNNPKYNGCLNRDA
jgi:hypothetical protein